MIALVLSDCVELRKKAGKKERKKKGKKTEKQIHGKDVEGSSMFWQIHVVESWDKLKGVKNFDTHQEKENGVRFSYKIIFKFKQ